MLVLKLIMIKYISVDYAAFDNSKYHLNIFGEDYEGKKGGVGGNVRVMTLPGFRHHRKSREAQETTGGNERTVP